ncbi:hypothetical protein CLI64_30030 (plasmid) [Nostoc sp. CENA543]|uniref:hypothetical protein n=1 Tax=Nostoc sp. CENA543 TaxID=1869241 RepID=UPI000CA098A3|nr:hypothetical protein [Nostoc sp. CENA543]AUT04712.1 hypothetical protein CLI64_30030 [Nostoc sp. CENA543]
MKNNALQRNTIHYSEWNDKIAQYFFKPEKAGRTVYLYVTEELINSLGADNGVGCQEFIQTVKNATSINGICKKALGSMQNPKWRYQRQGYPPYIGYLALFVLAAGTEGDFSPNAYYPRLRELLGEKPTSGQYPDFDKMQTLWKDLEKWANVDKSGELGIFKVNITGKWVHVGIPIAQTLLTEKELKVLPIIFAEAGLETISLPSERHIASLLVKYGRSYLRTRTLQLLEETSEDNKLHQALIERIVDELCTWDGTTEFQSEGKTQKYGILRLCCKLDLIAKRASFTLRCTTKHDFPEDGLILNFNNEFYYCDEYGNGWSSSILKGKIFDASMLDWGRSYRMESTDNKWCFKLPNSKIRIFVEGRSMGLPGIVEIGQLPKGSPFYLAARQECCSFLERWGTSSCEGFEKLHILKGLPDGWYLFKATAAHSDEIINNEYPILSFSTGTRLYLEGGLRVDKGNWFFRFAPPKLVLQCSDGTAKLYCNGRLLEDSSGRGIYELPPDLPVDKNIKIEARKEDNIINNLSLLLLKDFPLITSIKTPNIDCFGFVKTNKSEHSPEVRGALVKGIDCPPFNFNTLLPIQGKQCVVFVGKEAGQVAIYPEESILIDWCPVWAIAKGRLFDRAIFCGTSLKECKPKPSICKDIIKLNLWKKILLDNHKRTLPPIGDIRLKKLWLEFQKGAKNV